MDNHNSICTNCGLPTFPDVPHTCLPKPGMIAGGLILPDSHKYDHLFELINKRLFDLNERLEKLEQYYAKQIDLAERI